MKEKLIAALLASALVMVVTSSSAMAPSVSASQNPGLAVEKFVARLPISQTSRAPSKLVSLSGRESMAVKTTSSRVLVFDEVSGTELLAIGADEENSAASITKLMTARVLRAHGLNWDAKVKVRATSDGGGMAYFFPGDTVSVRDLWGAMLVGSSNTAAMELVRASGLSLDEFVAEMNANAAGLGMARTHFVDPTGLGSGNISTARDLTLLAQAAFNDPEITKTVRLPSFVFAKADGKERRIVSTNKLLTSFINKSPYQILGGKTGYITESGYNIVLKVERQNAGTLMVVVLGSTSNEARFQDAKSLTHWAFQNFHWPKALVKSTLK